MPRLITARKAARHLGKPSHFAVYDMVRRGLIPPGPLVRYGRAIQFNEELLLDWIERGGTAGKAGNNEEAQNQSESFQVAG